MAALGMETSSGDFEVIDLCFAGLPDLATSEAGPSNSNGSTKGKEKAKGGSDPGESCPIPTLTAAAEEKTWVALASGLSVGSQEAPADLKVQLLAEWLMGENGATAVGHTCLAALTSRTS